MKNTKIRKTGFCKSFLRFLFLIRMPLLFLASFFVIQVYSQNPESGTGSYRVSGKVMDERGEEVIGASVLLQGTSNGTITDIDGNFVLNGVPASGVVVVSYVGMETRDIPFDANSFLDIVLQDKAISIEEVVVVGYGTQSRVSVTGAVSSVKMDEIRKSPAPNLVSSLTGRLPGLVTIQNTGQPGMENIQIYLRGAATTNTKAPLIMVDGVPSDASVLSTIDANEIESVSILKDASSTAVFGVRGANGVILVTTRRGNEERIQLSVTAETGYQNYTAEQNKVNSWEHAMLRNEALRNDGYAENYTQRQIDLYQAGTNPLYPNTDWWNILMKDFSWMQRYNINASGGNKRVKYFLNAGYINQEGMFNTEPESVLGYDASMYLERYNFRANLDVKVNDWINAGLNVGGYINKVNGPGGFAGLGDPETIIQRYYGGTNATLPGPVTTEGMGDVPLGEPIIGATSNDSPYLFLNNTGYTRTDGANVNSSLFFKFDLNKITKGLSSKAQVSFNSASRAVSFARKDASGYRLASIVEEEQGDGSILDVPTWERTTPPQLEPLRLGKSSTFQYYMNMQLSLNYSRKFDGLHNVGGMILGQRDLREAAGGSSDNLLPYNMLSLSGRLTYDYDNRYFIEGNAGYNGSEQFHPDRRFGFFPAGSLGWVISNEDFMLNQSLISHMKVRASYGLVGNDQISSTRFLYLDNVAVLGGGEFASLGEGRFVNELLIGNPELTWEKALKQNYGLELTFFEDLSINTDVFFEDRTDILITRGTVPVLLGMPLNLVPRANLGEISNKGFEVEVNYRKRFNKDLTANIGGNVSFNKNTIEFIDEAPYADDYLYQYRRTGQSIGQSFGYTIDWGSPGNGYFTSQEEIDNYYPYTEGNLPRPGDFVYKDLNEDGEINTKDYAPLRYPIIPQVTFGLNANLRYKGFDVSFLFQGVSRAAKSYSGHGAKETDGEGLYYKHHLNAWTEEKYLAGDEIKYPALAVNSSSSLSSNDYFVVDRSYLRLKNAEIGYTIPKRLIKQAGMQSARFYLNGQNLLTWDNQPFSHIDPEQNNDVSVPILRIINLGLNVVF